MSTINEQVRSLIAVLFVAIVVIIIVFWPLHATENTPIIRQISSVINPQTNRIHLFGVTADGRVLQFDQRKGKWVELDQADAGFLNEESFLDQNRVITKKILTF